MRKRGISFHDSAGHRKATFFIDEDASTGICLVAFYITRNELKRSSISLIALTGMDINSTTNIGPNNPFCYSDISTFASSDCGAIKDQFGSLINNLDNGSPSQTLNLTLAFYCNLSAIFL